jgi:hypothetical protein
VLIVGILTGSVSSIARASLEPGIDMRRVDPSGKNSPLAKGFPSLNLGMGTEPARGPYSDPFVQLCSPESSLGQAPASLLSGTPDTTSTTSRQLLHLYFCPMGSSERTSLFIPNLAESYEAVSFLFIIGLKTLVEFA